MKNNKLSELSLFMVLATICIVVYLILDFLTKKEERLTKYASQKQEQQHQLQLAQLNNQGAKKWSGLFGRFFGELANGAGLIPN